MSEEKNETKENINGDNKFVFYFLIHELYHQI